MNDDHRRPTWFGSDHHLPPRSWRSPFVYLLWVGRHQTSSLIAATLWDTIGVASLAVMPWIVGAVIDRGIIAGDRAAFFLWLGVLTGLALLQAFAEAMRLTSGIENWLRASTRSIRVVNARILRAGLKASKRDVGETTTIAIGDTMGLSQIYFMISGIISSLISYAVGVVLVWQASPASGVFVLIAIPLFALLMVAFLRALTRKQTVERERAGALNSKSIDFITGLSVLLGFGGREFARRSYGEASLTLRDAGIELSRTAATSRGFQSLASGSVGAALFIFTAPLVAEGAVEPGVLVSMSIYAAFLVVPIQLIAQGLVAIAGARVSARKVVDLLASLPKESRSPSRTHVSLTDLSGVPVDGLLGVTGPRALEVCTALESGWVGSATDRSIRIEPGTYFFSGELRRQLDVHGRHDDATVWSALEVAHLHRVIGGLKDGLGTMIWADAKNFSGGERQRLALARGLLSDADRLFLVEPTAALDASTERLIALNLRRYVDARGALSIAMVTDRPALLASAHRVVFADVDNIATGEHADLMRESDAYRSWTTRDRLIDQEASHD